jgi:hypothetical protein
LRQADPAQRHPGREAIETARRFGVAAASNDQLAAAQAAAQAAAGDAARAAAQAAAWAAAWAAAGDAAWAAARAAARAAERAWQEERFRALLAGEYDEEAAA